jgi:hypothetical protein
MKDGMSRDEIGLPLRRKIAKEDTEPNWQTLNAYLYLRYLTPRGRRVSHTLNGVVIPTAPARCIPQIH